MFHLLPQIYILQITQLSQYKCTQLQYSFAVISEAPSTVRETHSINFRPIWSSSMPICYIWYMANIKTTWYGDIGSVLHQMMITNHLNMQKVMEMSSKMNLVEYMSVKYTMIQVLSAKIILFIYTRLRYIISWILARGSISFPIKNRSYILLLNWSIENLYKNVSKDS